MRRPDGSWDPFDDYVLDFAIARMEAGERICLVTLVEIEGASPRPLGAQMAVSESGQWVGYLSGGCIERAIAAEAVEAMQAGRSRRVRYGRGSRYIDISLPCGSAIELVFDVDISLARLRAVDDALVRRRQATLEVTASGPAIEDAGDEASSLMRPYLPRRRLLALGIGPVAVQLARIAISVGFDAVVYTPDEMTADAARELGLAVRPIGEAVDIGEADSRSAIVFAFHDHDREGTLLVEALRSDAFYIGAMGSRRTQVERLERLRRSGFRDDLLARIHGPAGLLPHARSASDIALSIVAEMVEAARNAETADLGATTPTPHASRRGNDEARSQARL